MNGGLGASVPDFVRDIQPLLEQACVSCHGPEKQKGSLRLDRRQSAFGIGDSGERIIIPHNSAGSLLMQLVDSADPDDRMPRKEEPLTPAQIALLRRWIDAGAPWPVDDMDARDVNAKSEMIVTAHDREHWAFRPLARVSPPDSEFNPIDGFIREALHTIGLDLSPPLDRRREARRVYFDLIGLPPTPEQSDAYAADDAPDAYERLVDRLIANPGYGERWAQPWLDVARYADSDGYERDADRNFAWPYRDWVIHAMNADLPYDRFVRWQIAGDELAPDDPDAVIATGFLAAGPFLNMQPTESEEEKRKVRYENLEDIVSTTGSAFLGLTLGCARCHDHKYDPIPTRDYYRLGAAFLSGARDELPINRDHRELERWLGNRRVALREEKMARLGVPEPDRVLLRAPVNPNNPTQRNVIKQWGACLEFSEAELRAWLSPQYRAHLASLEERAQSAGSAQAGRTLAFLDRSAEPATAWLLGRGDAYNLDEEITFGFLQVLQGRRSAVDYLDRARLAARTNDSTFQRAALALWLTDPLDGAGNLLARVIVNRIWQQHFGEGLVRTPNDFGLQGDRPSHPELLDWLALELIRGGWRLKPLQRLIMTSATYRQGGYAGGSAADKRRAIDPDNRLLSYRRPVRLDAETLRDAILAVSGILNPERGGPGIKPPIPEYVQVTRTRDKYPSSGADGPELWRRSIYLFTKRSVRLPLMEAFDAPDRIVSSGRRQNTTVPTQQLALLNSEFVRRRAADFAARLADTGDRERQVALAFELALGRPPTAAEFARSLAFLEHRHHNPDAGSADTALTDFCHALFNLNAFIYVD
jgi:hypothetical protein